MEFKSIILSVICFGLFAQSFGQEGTITVSSKRNDDKSVDISFEKNDPGTMTVNLNFRHLENSSVTSTVFKAEGYSGVLTTLRPLNKDNVINLSYNYRYIRGRISPKIDSTFIYALPYSSGTEVYVRESGFLKAQYFGNTTPDDWKVYQFYTKEQQEVVGSRKGVVVDVVDKHEDVDWEDKSYTSSTNSITVEHKDGTLLKYDGLSKSSIRIKVGDTVFPGQPLAKNTKRSAIGYAVSYMLMYLKSADLDANKGKSMANSTSFYGFVTPLFEMDSEAVVLNKDSSYTSSITPNLIGKEMSKKEMKKYEIK